MRDYETQMLNNVVDISREFIKHQNTYFNGMKITKFNAEIGEGMIEWKRYARKERMSFNVINRGFEEVNLWEFPPSYEKNPTIPFSISFINSRTIRIRVHTQPIIKKSLSGHKTDDSLIIVNDIDEYLWDVKKTDKGVIYKNENGSVNIIYDPFHFEFRDSSGNLLTKTQHLFDAKCLYTADPIPFSFVRRGDNLKRHIAASFSLSPDEKIFGCGESFTRLNKRGQKIVLWARDACGVQTSEMYKPIPFFMSSRGYGMFINTSSPITFDFGNTYDQANTIFVGDDYLDVFVFLGNPKEILSEYTSLTGRSPMPPLWSFGLWMSRITYKSEDEVREVAKKLRKNKIPCDVIHLDTGWFEKDWCCNYKFSHTRFNDPEKMISDLKKDGFHFSLWQLPYFTPKNELYKEIIENRYAVYDADGNLPTEDAIIDFSNTEAVKWYQQKLKELFKIGIEAIKVDFGEAAPIHGVYASGKSGFFEHNLYPLRYNKAVYEITEKMTGSSIIWGRSAWAGSQRYPVHWGGDAENTDCGMAATLRGGLSLGLCGFSFWSHDIGGFVKKSPEELYRRWMPFGMLTSHSRCHGQPPKEPWGYSDEFMNDFRKSVELKYSLMPYIYAQAKLCSKYGYPMMRTLFFEYPEDYTSWFIEDEYMFGEQMLVAPLFEENIEQRDVYLPPGIWIDYQTRKVYEGGRWHKIKAGEIPIIILVKDGSVIPQVKVAQSTSEINWEEIELVTYRDKAKTVKGLNYFQGNDELEIISYYLD